MNKVIVIILFMITLNLGFIWVDNIGLISNPDISGQEVDNLYTSTLSDSWIITGFIMVVLAFLAILISSFLHINAFAVIAFTEIFWVPYANTVTIFNQILAPFGAAFYIGLISIFTTLMTFLYIYTMIEWTRISGGL